MVYRMSGLRQFRWNPLETVPNYQFLVNSEADTPEELLALLDTLVPEMVELNGDGGSPSIPYSVMLDHLRAERTTA